MSHLSWPWQVWGTLERKKRHRRTWFLGSFFVDSLCCKKPCCKWIWSGFWVPNHLLTGYLEHWVLLMDIYVSYRFIFWRDLPEKTCAWFRVGNNGPRRFVEDSIDFVRSGKILRTIQDLPELTLSFSKWFWSYLMLIVSPFLLLRCWSWESPKGKTTTFFVTLWILKWCPFNTWCQENEG